MAESQIDAYVRANDEATDYVNAQLDGVQQRALEDIDDLFRNVEEREEELWLDIIGDAETTIDEYEAEEDRDLEWMLGMAGMSGAALTQFLLDNVDGLVVKPIAYKEQLLDPFSLSRREMVAAGKRGAVGLEVEAVTRFQTLRASFYNDVSFLSKMDTMDLYRTLNRYDALLPPQKTIGDAMGYVNRMTSYPAKSPQWQQAVNDLIDHNSGRALKGMNRRAVERIYSAREAESTGEADPWMVWIGEGGKNTCDFCLDRFGVVQRMSQWIQDGLPGADVCAGGDLCKCGLVAA